MKLSSIPNGTEIPVTTVDISPRPPGPKGNYRVGSGLMIGPRPPRR